ncbi:nuclease-related domain-containing protein [Paenibacillus sp. CN-4]|uniref:nuclease-related domain-containing protein n=1 Tax=Paenibacillus nanchangensis TaxID=3348343 RepID=UPI00397D994A
MAILYPEAALPQIQGEQKVLWALKKGLSDAWHVFHEPLIHETRPDFVLYSSYYGIIILEVKDYKAKTIQRLSPDIWTIFIEDRVKRLTSPLKQARDYAYELMQVMESSDVLSNTQGAFKGKLKFPVGYACWFANLSWEDVVTIGISEVIPKQWILTADDLLEMKLESKFVDNLISKFKVNQLNNEVLTTIKALLYPEILPLSFELRQRIWFDDFKKNIIKFPDFVDEILFIATEIRHLHMKNVKLDQIFIYYFQNHILKSGTVAEKISNILISMGISNTINNRKKDNVCILPFYEFKDNSVIEYSFIVGCSFSSLTEEKELSLKLIFRDNPSNIYISSSDLS